MEPKKLRIIMRPCRSSASQVCTKAGQRIVRLRKSGLAVRPARYPRTSPAAACPRWSCHRLVVAPPSTEAAQRARARWRLEQQRRRPRASAPPLRRRAALDLVRSSVASCGLWHRAPSPPRHWLVIRPASWPRPWRTCTHAALCTATVNAATSASRHRGVYRLRGNYGGRIP